MGDVDEDAPPSHRRLADHRGHARAGSHRHDWRKSDAEFRRAQARRRGHHRGGTRRVPVIAGTGSNSTAEAIELSQHAEKAGADGLLIVTPYYNKPTQEGLYQHFKAINDAVGIPIVIYNIPGRSIVDMSVATMARVFELKNVTGVKDATANLARVSQQRAAMGPEFNQLSGEDATALGFMAHGGNGCISVGVERGAETVRGIPERLPQG